MKNEKKACLVRTNKFIRVVDRKQNYFQGWPYWSIDRNPCLVFLWGVEAVLDLLWFSDKALSQYLVPGPRPDPGFQKSSAHTLVKPG